MTLKSKGFILSGTEMCLNHFLAISLKKHEIPCVKDYVSFCPEVKLMGCPKWKYVDSSSGGFKYQHQI